MGENESVMICLIWSKRRKRERKKETRKRRGREGEKKKDGK